MPPSATKLTLAFPNRIVFSFGSGSVVQCYMSLNEVSVSNAT